MTEDLRSLMLDLDRRLRHIEDIEEIRRLVARYAYHATRANGREMAELFTDDGIFDVRVPGGGASQIKIEGNENLTAFYSRMKPGGTTPMIHDLTLDLHGDEARGTCVLDSPCYTGEQQGYCGYYEDQFRRTNGCWLFKSRVFFFFQGGVPSR